MNNPQIHLWPILIVAAFLLSFILRGLRAKTRDTFDYGFGGRYTGKVGGGIAIASSWISASSFLGLAGLLYLQGYFALAYVVGWTGGYVLLLVLMAGQTRRFGKYTAPDFVGARYYSPAARLISALISIAISVIYCTAQFKGIGLVFAWLFGIGYRRGVILGAVAAVSYVVICGMLGVKRSHRMLYFVIIGSFAVPLMYLSYKLGYFWPLPPFSYGSAMTELSQEFKINFAAPFAGGSLFQWTALCFTLMVGTVGLPHVLSRFYIVPNIRDARWSLVWGLFFIALLYWSAPAYAVFGRLLEARNGIMPDPAASRSMADVVVLKTALMGNLPPWLIGILLAGATCAAFSTVTDLLIAVATSLSHDIYYRLINPQASESGKVAVARWSILAFAALVLLLAMYPPGLIVEITAVAFALAGNTIFPVFLLGIWWGRANRQGAIAGMLVGTVVTFAAPLFGRIAPIIADLCPITSSALIGAPLVIAVAILVSLATAPPPEEMRSFLAKEVHGRLD